MSFLKKIKTGIDKKYYLCGFHIYTKYGIKTFYNKYKNLFKGYDKIYVLNSNIGEAYLVFKYFANGIKSDRTLFVATKPYHVEIIETFLPSCNYIFESKINLDSFPSNFNVNKKNFIVLFNHDYYITLEQDIREGKKDAHYYKRMKSFFNLLENFPSNNVNIVDNVQKTLSEKLKRIELNLNYFIFIAPEANSCLDIDIDILNDIGIFFREAGFDIFWNITNSYVNSENYKSCFLSLPEALLLCTKAKAIISLQSGFAEFLTEANVPTYILYSKLKNRTQEEQMNASKVLKGYTLSELPHYKNNIKEYIINNQNDYIEIFDKILEDLCSKK